MGMKPDPREYSPSLSPRFRRRRPGQLICYALFTVLLVGFFSSRCEYSTPHFRGRQLRRIGLDDLTSPSHTLVRHFDPETRHIFPDYLYQYNIGHGFEGAVDVYKHVPSGELVVLKTFYMWSAQDPVPSELKDYLETQYNHTVDVWPREVAATLRDYSSKYYPDLALLAHAIDCVYVPYPPGTWLPPDKQHPANLPWRLVMPFHESADLQSATRAFQYLNFTLEELDFLYRPRFRTIFKALAKLHTAAIPSEKTLGFCHDDVKADNVFHVSETMDTILADMGQVRPFQHRVHRRWKDCRLQDAHRAWKTYMTFLRLAGGPDSGFDKAFVDRTTPWAKAYWAWRDRPRTPLHMLGAGEDPLWGSVLEWRKVRILVPRLNRRTGRVERVPMPRDNALRVVEGIRREEKALRDVEVKNHETMPWWWWNVTEVLGRKDVDLELEVTGDKARIIGTDRPPKADGTVRVFVKEEEAVHIAMGGHRHPADRN